MILDTSAPAINFATEAAGRKPRRRTAKKTSELHAMRDALPFFKKGRGKEATSWWNVTPTGNYTADLETGKGYARDFLPLMTFNAGSASLGAIVSDMARAGRDPTKNPKDWRGIDSVALGFLMEMGNSLQSAMASIAIAACAIELPTSDLGTKFVALVKSGDVLRGPTRSTLFHDPNAGILDQYSGSSR